MSQLYNCHNFISVTTAWRAKHGTTYLESCTVAQWKCIHPSCCVRTSQRTWSWPARSPAKVRSVNHVTRTLRVCQSFLIKMWRSVNVELLKLVSHLHSTQSSPSSLLLSLLLLIYVELFSPVSPQSRAQQGEVNQETGAPFTCTVSLGFLPLSVAVCPVTSSVGASRPVTWMRTSPRALSSISRVTCVCVTQPIIT